MQGRDSFAKPHISIDDNEDTLSTDLQSPQFFIPEDYTTDELEPSTQLEDLQQLLEIAHQNEENAKQHLAEMAEDLDASLKALEDLKVEFKVAKTQDSLIINNLKETVKSLYDKQDTTADLIETLRKELDQSTYNLNVEKLVNANLKSNLDDIKCRFEQSEAGLKKVILKQSHMLASKDNEISQLKAFLENNKPYYHNTQPAKPTFFNAANANPEETHHEIKFYIPKKIETRWG